MNVSEIKTIQLTPTINNLGIGTSSPAAKLDIGGNTDGQVQCILTRGSDEYFQLQAINQSSSNGTNAVVSKFGVRHDTSETVMFNFIRGNFGHDGSLAIVTDNAERMRVNSVGNIGIGKTNPGYKLDVSGDINFTGTLYQNGSVFSAGSGGSGGSSPWSTSGSNISFSNGNVGIYGSSVQTPSSKLEIWDNQSGGNWNMIRLYGGGDGNGDRAGIAMGSFGANEKTLGAAIFFEQQPVWPGRTGDLIFATKPYNYPQTFNSVDPVNNERMRITWNGYTGIGTNAPKAKLHVNGLGDNGTSLASASRTWITSTNSSGTNHNISTATFGNMSIYASGEIVSSGSILSHGTTSYSDARIKKNIVDINDASALETIRAIKPKKYDYEDKLTAGSQTVWGFIAQEVAETLDYAVTKMEKAIPNIMCNASFDPTNNTITFENFNANNLLRKEDGSLCNELNLKTWNSREINATIEHVINASTVKLSTVLKHEDVNGCIMDGVPTTEEEAIALEATKITITNKIFVYGQTVSDFHVLKKEAIFTVAVAALQEIDRRQVEDNEALITLEDKLSELRSENTQLINQLKDITERLTKAGI